MKKRYYLYILITVMMIALGATLISAYLTDQKDVDKEVVIGKVGVSKIEVYYLVDSDNTEYPEVIAYNRNKNGVYDINIIDRNSLDYITNLRVDIYVDSNVDSYLRVKINDQIIRKTTNYQGVVTETALRHNPITFYPESSWHVENDPLDVRNTYYYYPERIKQTTNEPLKISFIIPYPENQDFSAYGEGHILQLGIKYEIVQADFEGPLKNWNLSTPPWGGAW